MLQRLETSARNGPTRTFEVSLNTETTPPGCLVPNNVHVPFQAEPLSIIHFQSTVFTLRRSRKWTKVSTVKLVAYI